MTLVISQLSNFRAPGCKSKCLRMGIVVKWNRRSKAYVGGVKYCSRCEQFMRFEKRFCPCCGCTLRMGTRAKNRSRRLSEIRNRKEMEMEMETKMTKTLERGTVGRKEKPRRLKLGVQMLKAGGVKIGFIRD